MVAVELCAVVFAVKALHNLVGPLFVFFRILLVVHRQLIERAS